MWMLEGEVTRLLPTTVALVPPSLSLHVPCMFRQTEEQLSVCLSCVVQRRS